MMSLIFLEFNKMNGKMMSIPRNIIHHFLLQPINVVIILLLNCSSSFGTDRIDMPETTLHLNIFFKEAKPNDTIFLTADNIVMALADNPRYKYTAQNDGTGHFRFEVKVPDTYGYLTLSKNRNYKNENLNGIPIRMTKELFYEPGDSLEVSLSYIENESGIGGGSHCSFTGIGAEKYNLSNLIYEGYNYTGLIYTYDEIHKGKLKILESYKHKISDVFYNILKADLIYVYKIFSSPENLNLKVRSKSINSNLEVYVDLPDISYDDEISDEGLANSIIFQKYLFTNKSGFFTRASYEVLGNYSPVWICNAISKSNLQEKTKEVLILRVLYSPRPGSENPDQWYRELANYIKSPQYIILFEDLERKTARKEFSNFELEDIYGKMRSLKNIKNKVVIIDFWFSGCGACKEYYQKILSNAESYFAGNDSIVFLSISIDTNKEKWKKSVKDGTYSSAMVTNLYTNGEGKNNTIITNNDVRGYPFVMVLDRNSNIRFSNSSNLYDLNSLISTIKSVKGE